MGLFVILFWCPAATHAVLRFSSRFGVFNSRLGAKIFPFSLQREFARKRLIDNDLFGTEQHFSGTIAKNPGCTGITGNFLSPRNGWRRNLRCRSALPAEPRR
jgi:hypothetical protein